MAKKRMVVGYLLQQDSVMAPGEPVKATVKIPDNATIVCLRIDPQLNFVAFAEVWSHPEGTEVNFREETFAVVGTKMEIPHGSWEWFETLSAGPQIYHVYRKTAPKVLQ